MMRIDEKIEKYLVESNRKDDFNKWVAVVNSATTQEQLTVAMRMGKEYYNKYGESFIDRVKAFIDKITVDVPNTPLFYKMENVLKNKKDKLDYEDAKKLLKFKE